ncbi:MAG TPA: cysteine peptidase family C39 domain-containing protein [Bacteroidota bacterium]|nr:cysteine peptidase family C39 domain-containing protein [Bacteroidota bacterium]
MKLFLLLCLLIFLAAILFVPFWMHRYQAWRLGGEYLGKEGVIFQSKANACGPASLAMICRSHKIPIGELDIERSIGMTQEGVTMLALKDEADRDGLKASGWRLTSEEFEKVQFPVLLFVNGDHFVVADSVNRGAAYLRDPAVGRLKISEKNLAHIWRGETLIFRER